MKWYTEFVDRHVYSLLQALKSLSRSQRQEKRAASYLNASIPNDLSKSLFTHEIISCSSGRHEYSSHKKPAKMPFMVIILERHCTSILVARYARGGEIYNKHIGSKPYNLCLQIVKMTTTSRADVE